MQENDLKQRLREVLAAYGAEPARWPVDQRDALLTVVESADIAAALAEAGALDAALDRATPGVVDEGLAAGILARARTTAQDATDNVTAFAPRAQLVPPSNPASVEPESSSFPWRFGFGHAPEAALLAASLLVGVWIGGTGIVDTALTGAELALSTETVDEDEINLYEALQGIDVTEEGDVL